MKTATDYNDRPVSRGRPGWRAALIAALVALVVFGLPAAASEIGPTPAAFTVKGTVTWVGRPDSTTVVGVAACPSDEPVPACASRRSTTAAADGSYSLPLPHGRSSTWAVFAVVGVGSSLPPVSLATSAPTEVTVPCSPHATVSFAITTRAVAMRVVDGDGNAFPGGMTSVMAIPTSSSAAVGMSVGGADANGDALLLVDPTVEYNVNAFAQNTGWPNPWVSPTGIEFHFSRNGVTALGADLQEGTTFVIVPPA